MRFPPLSGVRVIGLCGHARHGKDTLAKELVYAWPGAERFAFSDGISAVARASGRMGAARDPRVLQDEGIAARRQHPTVWLDVLYGAIADRRPELAIVTGVRFPDEADMIRQMGGEVIRVTRLEHDGRLFVSDDRPHGHAAEAHIDDLDADDELRVGPGEMETFAIYAAHLAIRLRLAPQPLSAA